MFVPEVKSTKKYTFTWLLHPFLHWNHKRSCFAKHFKKLFFFCKEAVFREVEAEAKAVLVGAVPKGP
jgi:hypothetical protein